MRGVEEREGVGGVSEELQWTASQQTTAHRDERQEREGEAQSVITNVQEQQVVVLAENKHETDA